MNLRTITRWLSLGATTTLLALALAACGDDDDDGGTTTPSADGTPTGETTKVTLMLDWTPNTNHLGIYVAQARGWYEEAGLEVEIVEPGTAGVEAIVGNGEAEFGISFQEYLTPARAQDIPVVSIAAIIQHNTSSFVSLAGEGIETPADLEDKRYGGFTGPLVEAIIAELVRCDGGDPASITYVDASIDPLVGLERDDFDFAWIFDAWDGLRLSEIEGVDISTLRFIDYVDCIPDWYTPILITNEDMIANQPGVVSAFMEATARGYELAMDDPDAAADALLEASPELDEELVRLSAEYLSTRFVDEGRAWGTQDLETWERFTTFLVDAGMIDEAIDNEAAFTNDFLPGE